MVTSIALLVARKPTKIPETVKVADKIESCSGNSGENINHKKEASTPIK